MVKASISVHVSIFCEFIEQPYKQQKNEVSDKHTAQNKSASSDVLSIKIAKVQEDVEWESGGKSFLHSLWLHG